jgi:hypothetical protein
MIMKQYNTAGLELAAKQLNDCYQAYSSHSNSAIQRFLQSVQAEQLEQQKAP